VTIEVAVDRSVITIGDYVEYVVRITADRDVEIPAARLHPDLGGFEILDFSLAEKPERVGEQLVWEDVYTISTYTTGDYQVPPYRVVYRTAAGEEREAASGPLRIEVRSITQEESEAADIADIKPPVPIRPPGRWWIFVLAAAGLAGAVSGVLAYVRFGRRRARPEGPPPLPPHELALMELEALRRSDIVLDGDAEGFSVAVSAVVRRYVEGRFAVPALERTSEETVGALRERPEAAPHADAFEHFFDSCDLVKFGGNLFQWDDLRAVIDEAENLVRMTRSPAEEPPALAIEEGELEAESGPPGNGEKAG